MAINEIFSKDGNGITSNKVTYKVEASSGNNCPTTEEYKK
jgi:hypothetical protein